MDIFSEQSSIQLSVLLSLLYQKVEKKYCNSSAIVIRK